MSTAAGSEARILAVFALEDPAIRNHGSGLGFPAHPLGFRLERVEFAIGDNGALRFPDVVELSEERGTSLGEEYFSTARYSYGHSSWNENITLSKRPYTFADLLNSFSAAGLWSERTIESQLSADTSRRFPHKQQWMNDHLGILVFRLRPLRDR